MQNLVSWGRLKLFRIEEYQLKLVRSYFGSGFEALLYDLFSSCVFKGFGGDDDLSRRLYEADNEIVPRYLQLL